MERQLRVFSTHEEADRADVAYYASLTPAERLEILLELINRHRKTNGDAAQGFVRVCRVIELSQS
ncbi:MAG: hypothetical protein SGI90_00065 [Candidatus Eisenbacteria bacterium]|nr:hypothetical protein [Candidatus Eisenbacteria bacterium]